MKSKKLYQAIGLIDDDTILEFEECAKERTVSESKNSSIVPFSQYAGLAAAVLLLVVGSVIMLNVLAPETPSIVQQPHETTNFAETTDNGQSRDEEKPPLTANNNITWLVEPTLHQGQILMYCEWEDAYLITNYESEGRIVNETTGLLNDEIITDPFRMNEHSGTASTSRKGWLYDPDLDLFGWWGTWSQYGVGVEQIIETYPMSEFSTHFPELSDQIITVTILDTVAFAEHPQRLGNDDPRFGGSAVMYNGEFVTDFIFSFDYNLSRTLPALIVVENYYGAARGWQSSIVDSSGNVLLPFEFMRIRLIDENSAFVQTSDGYWGIIKIPSTPHPITATLTDYS